MTRADDFFSDELKAKVKEYFGTTPLGLCDMIAGNDLSQMLEDIKQCGDCISRQAVIELIDQQYPMLTGFKVPINDLPSVTPTRKKGKWVEQDGFDGDTYYDCSECGESFCLIDGTPTDNLYNYCPSCGAEMGEEE